ALPELQLVGAETRGRCFLNCGRSGETGARALAIQADSAFKQWKCFQFGCGKGGNLVSLCDLLKTGANAGGRPRGDRFKAIAADMKAMTEGGAPPAVGSPAIPKSAPAKAAETNVPLARSDDERARARTALERQ